MSKLFHFILCISICAQVSKAQTSAINLEKYWYYRYRLMNDFILIGDCQGCSVPAMGRNFANDSILKWGDSTVDLGWYIGVLATEYNQLKNQGQSTDATAQELFYALEAFNRLDYFAEQYWGGTVGALNGFFVRDDVSKDNFINGIIDPATGIPVDPDAFDRFNHFNSDKTSTAVVGKVESGYADGSEPTEESHDQVWYMMMGLSLVPRLIDANDVYTDKSGTVKTFRDGQTSFVQEAKNIVKRMISHMKNEDWIIKNPVINDCVKNGPNGPRDCGIATAANAKILSFGAAEAACAIDNGYQPRITSFEPPMNCLNFHDTKSLKYYHVWDFFRTLDPCYQNSGTLIIGIPGGDMLIKVCSMCFEDIKYLLLVAIGNSAFFCSPTCLIPESVFGIKLRTYTNNSSSLLTIRGIVGFEYLPLLHKVLWQDEAFASGLNFEGIFLNTAPCEGPFNYSQNNVPNYGHPLWSTPNTFRNAEARGVANGPGVNNCGFASIGEFHGLDYMFLHNLNRMVKGSSLPYINLIDRTISGTISGTQTYKAFRSITSDAQLADGADVVFRAGEEIDLKEFDSQLGSFDAQIGKLQCQTDGSYFKTAQGGNPPDGWDMLASTDTTGFTGYTGLEALYPNKEPAYEAPDFDIEEITSSSNFSIYPNPTTNQFTVHIPGNESPANITVKDVTGRTIRETATSGSYSVINLTGCSKGIYFIKIIQNDGVFVEKIVYQ